MPTVRKTGGRAELDAAWTLIRATFADLHGASGVRAKVVAVVTDLGNLRTTLAAVQTDVANLRSWANTLATKLNADAGVTDTNYAAPSAVTSSAPSALTAANPDAATAVDVTLIGA